MNKFFKKMLATSATILVLGQLNPALSTTFTENDFDYKNPDFRTKIREFLQKTEDADKQLQTLRKALDPRDEAKLKAYEAALNGKEDATEGLETAKRDKDQAEAIYNSAKQAHDIFVVDAEPLIPQATKPDLEQKLRAFEEEIAELTKKNDFCDNHEHDVSNKAIKKAYNSEFNKLGESKDLAGDIEKTLPKGHTFLKFIKNKALLTTDELQKLQNSEDIIRNFQEQIKEAEINDKTDQDRYAQQHKSWEDKTRNKDQLKTEMDNAKRAFDVSEFNYQQALKALTDIEDILNSPEHKTAFNAYQASQFNLHASTQNLTNTFEILASAHAELETDFTELSTEAQQNVSTLSTINTFFKTSFADKFKVKSFSKALAAEGTDFVYSALADSYIKKGELVKPGTPVVPAGDVVEKAGYESRIADLEHELNAREAEITNLRTAASVGIPGADADNAPAHPLVNNQIIIEMLSRVQDIITSNKEEEVGTIVKFAASLLGKSEQEVYNGLGFIPSFAVPTDLKPEDTDSSTGKLELNADQYNFIYTGKFRNLLTCVGGKTVEISSKAKSAQKENIKKEALKLGLAVKE